MNNLRVARRLVRLARNVILSAEGDKCGEKGCIRQIDGKWRIMSGKTGKYWPQHYDTKEDAENVLKRYHGYGF